MDTTTDVETRHMKNKKTILGSGAAILTAAALIAGGTFAAWSDFAEIDNEHAQAGILQLNAIERVGTAGIDGLHLAPGENKAQVFYLASNDAESTPDGTLSMTFKDLVDIEADGVDSSGNALDAGRADNCTTNSEAVAEGVSEQQAMEESGNCNNPDGELSSQARAQVLVSAPQANASSCPNSGIYGSVPGGGGNTRTMADWEDVTINLGTVTPGSGVCVRIETSLPNLAGNVNDAVQGDLMDFTVRFDLAQA